MTYLALKTYLCGFLVAAAYDNLSYNKTATQSSKYPGPITLYDAHRAIDGNTSTCMRTDNIGVDSPNKLIWWKVDLGGVYTIYSIHILFLNYIGFGCTQGFYGSNCGIKCPINCGNGACHIQNGTCLTCEAGWTGGTCSIKCKDGWYGKNCRQLCTGHCRDNATCNHVTGQCDRGCDAGWTDNLCDKECSDGTYGFDCVNNCSGHCLNYSACDKHNGHCKNGCTPGYTYSLCNKHNLRNSSDDKDISTSTIFLLISFTINIAFITCCCILIRGVYTRRVSILGFNPSCKKKSEQYADTDIKTDEDANYQELGPPRVEILTTYQNTTLQ